MNGLAAPAGEQCVIGGCEQRADLNINLQVKHEDPLGRSRTTLSGYVCTHHAHTLFGWALGLDQPHATTTHD